MDAAASRKRHASTYILGTQACSVGSSGPLEATHALALLLVTHER